MPLLETDLLQGHRELRLAHLALSVMTMGYVWQEGENNTVKVSQLFLRENNKRLSPYMTGHLAVVGCLQLIKPREFINLSCCATEMCPPFSMWIHSIFRITSFINMPVVCFCENLCERELITPQ